MRNQRIFYDKKIGFYNNPYKPGSLYSKVVNLIGKNNIILDVGCGNGIVAKELKKNKNRIIGVEISGKMAEKASEYTDEIKIGDIEKINPTWHKNYFNVILLLDVLEHLFDPEKTLVKLKSYLKNNGIVIVSLPNIANWEIRKNLLFGKFDYSDNGIMDNGHLRFFTYNNALQLFEKAGYKLDKSDYVLTYPIILGKLDYRLKFFNIMDKMKKYFFRLFAYQFIFVLKKEST